MRDPFELNSLRIDPADERFPRSAKSKKWHREFVQVPWAWVERLQSSRRISTYKLTLLLLYEGWRTGGRPIALSNILTKAEGLPPRSKSRALKELEHLGLIQVDRHLGRAPRVILRYLNDGT